MKFRYFSTVLIFIILVNHSHQQGFNFNPLSNLSNVGSNLLNNYGGNSQTGLVGTIRNRLTNTTSGILSRLEQPRDRVIALIRPAVKSEFSRNVTNVLNSIWERIQASNISLIQNPVIRTNVVRPINISLERLKQITAEDVEHAEVNGSNLEIINLNNDGEEQQFREYIISSSTNNEERSSPLLLLVTDNETLANREVENSLNSKDEISLNNDIQSNGQTVESTEQPIAVESKDEPRDQVPSNDKSEEQVYQNEQTESKDEQAKESDQVVEQPKEDEPNEPVKSVNKRRARFMDQYTYVTPDRVRNFYNRVQQNRMRECLGLAICESNCRPHLYGGQGGGSFGSLFDRVQSFNLDHEDNDYYLNARRYGQQFYSPQYFDECSYCHQRYRCRHNREHLINSFARMGEFY